MHVIWGEFVTRPQASQTPFSARSITAIVGSRSFEGAEYFIDQTVAKVPVGGTVVSGGARGVDSLAEQAATVAGLSVISYRPERERSMGRYVIRKWLNGHDQGLIEHNGFPLSYLTFAEAAKRRNWHIVGDASYVVALWDGMSSGTSHSIAAAHRLSRPVEIWMEGDS